MSVDPRVVAPFVSFGATLLVRRQLTRAYRRRTGQDSPAHADLSVPLRTALAWAGLIAVSTALVDVLIERGAAHLSERQKARAALH